MPVEASERLERLPGPEFGVLMQWMEQMSAAIHRVKATLERLEGSVSPLMLRLICTET
jgi:hypothetical protein